LVQVLARGAVKLSDHPDLKQSFLLAVRKGRKAMLLWLLNWLRQLFGLILLVLTQRHTSRH
jgi:hypothetical protein